ncbi:MAG: polyprenyl synthetase family protein [Ruminococcus sp.]|nr:polyprenyl synthetase family protein [Ruminococcus sp.]
MSNFNDTLNRYIEFTEKELKNFNNYSHENRPQVKLIDAMNYSLRAGGKRLRPALVYAFCEALGGEMETAVAPACAIEMLHTFSLIHDDLPAMDDDDFRRGKPSCHKAFDEAMAILAGDALAVLPFEIIADTPHLTSDQKVLIISVLANSVGRDGMIGGQVIDMENEKCDVVDEENLRNLYRCKTGQLIAVSCVMGAICADAENETIRAAAEYGLRLGFAFQVIDDILDVTSTTEELGKPVGSDEKCNKKTYVSLFGMEKAKEAADRATSEALEWLDAIPNNEFLIELTETLLKRKN